jgi:hypothetical protein
MVLAIFHFDLKHRERHLVVAGLGVDSQPCHRRLMTLSSVKAPVIRLPTR